jgi:F1F0 ATPase subunit 2
MNSPYLWMLSGLAGIALGALFYGGLWWTVRGAVHARRPEVWFVGSLVVRLGMMAAGIYLVGGGHWERIVACLAGFLIARMCALILSGKTGVRHAP